MLYLANIIETNTILYFIQNYKLSTKNVKIKLMLFKLKIQ